MSSSHILGVGSTEPRRRWTLARVLKGSPRSLRVMAPPPLLYAYHTLGVFRHHLWCLSTAPQCGIPTFTVGTCSHDVKIKMEFLVAHNSKENEPVYVTTVIVRRYRLHLVLSVFELRKSLILYYVIDVNLTGIQHIPLS